MSLEISMIRSGYDGRRLVPLAAAIDATEAAMIRRSVFPIIAS
jgi:hypothetical protein